MLKFLEHKQKNSICKHFHNEFAEIFHEESNHYNRDDSYDDKFSTPDKPESLDVDVNGKRCDVVDGHSR